MKLNMNGKKMNKINRIKKGPKIVRDDILLLTSGHHSDFHLHCNM